MTQSLKLVKTMYIWVFILILVPSISWTQCSTEGTILNYEYIGGCEHTEVTSFTLNKPANITKIRIWFDTSMAGGIAGDSMFLFLSGPDGYSNSASITSNGKCQGRWCEAIWNIDQQLKAGDYDLIADANAICANPSGQTTLVIYGCELENQPSDDTDNNTQGINPPKGVSVIDATSNPSKAPVYMGNIVAAGDVPELTGKMELSVDFPAYNKPVDIWILIALPDGRFYTANESGKCLGYSSGSLATLASGVSGTKTEKTILSPFETGSANTAFEPLPVDGTWTAYWLVAPDSNGDIFQAIENESYEFGFYSFLVKTDTDINDTTSVHITHSSGASADVPKDYVSEINEALLEQISLPDESRLWDWNNVGWKFISTGSETVKDEVSLKLPADGVDGEQVLVYSHTGDWIKLNSESVTLDSGRHGRLVKIKDIPTPWIFVVAKPTDAQSNVQETPESTTFEQLYWTDRNQWSQNITNWLIDALNSETQEETTKMARRFNPKTLYIHDLIKDLSDAINFLNAAKLGGALDQSVVGSPLPAIGLTPFALYLNGLDFLYEVRNNWKTYYAEEKETHYFSDDQYMEQAIETALADYVPWGIDFMRFLLHTGTIGSFDMRIIGPYGQEAYADAKLTDCEKNKDIEKDFKSSKLTIENSETDCYLRLYSRRAVATTYTDWLKDWKLETVVRWMPTILSAAGLVSGGVATPFIFASLDQLINFLQDYYDDKDNSQAYLHCEAASTALGAVDSFVTDIAPSMLRVPSESISLGSGASVIIQSIYSLALLYGVRQTDWFMLKDIKPLTAGTRSYCPKGDCAKHWWFGDMDPIAGYDQIPPIQVIGLLQGTPKGYPVNGYPIKQIKIMAWTIPLTRNRADLHKHFIDYVSLCEENLFDFPNAKMCQAGTKWTGGLADIGFYSYSRDNWPLITSKTEPAAQSIRVAFSKSILDQLAKDLQLSSSPTADQYQLVLRAEAEDGDRAIFHIVNFDEARAGDDPEKQYFTVVIEGKWKNEDASLGGLDKLYDGHRAKMGKGILQKKLKLQLTTTSDETPLANGEIDFNVKEGKELISLNPDDVEAERIHLGTAELIGDDSTNDSGEIELTGITLNFDYIMEDIYENGVLCSVGTLHLKPIKNSVVFRLHRDTTWEGQLINNGTKFSGQYANTAIEGYVSGNVGSNSINFTCKMGGATFSITGSNGNLSGKPVGKGTGETYDASLGKYVLCQNIKVTGTVSGRYYVYSKTQK
ncbi:MAG: hypothetical protein HQK72_03240 [Desulfamplus sp.]|nr:hypothetical protein [Desulfamplus sp.]